MNLLLLLISPWLGACLISPLEQDLWEAFIRESAIPE